MAGAHFHMKQLARNLDATRTVHRFLALQRSGQFSELRIVPAGRSRTRFNIAGYRWPSKKERRRRGVGKATWNPALTLGSPVTVKLGRKRCAGTLTAMNLHAGTGLPAYRVELERTGRERATRTVLVASNAIEPATAKNPPTPNQVFFGQRGKRKVGWIHRETPTRYYIAYKEGHQAKFVWRKKSRVSFLNPCPKTANPGGSDRAHAVKLSERFHGFKPRKITKQKVTIPRAWTHLGACSQVNYVSDKWDGKTREYYHEFDGNAQVFASPRQQKNGDGLLLIKGNFSIKPEGITG